MKTHQTTVIVRLVDDSSPYDRNGLMPLGYGEASPNDFYGVGLDRMEHSLHRCAQLLQPLTIVDGPRILEAIRLGCEGLRGIDRFSMAACDIAFHDLSSRLENMALHDWLDARDDFHGKTMPLSSITIGLGSLDEVDEQLNEYKDWPILKVKLGGTSDLETVAHIRRQSTATIRVDANGGWTPEQAIEYSYKLADLGVEFIEQPIPPGDLESQRLVHRHSALPIIADESCVTFADVVGCEGAWSGINIKLGKCGGIAEALRMIESARKHDLAVMIGCMTESSVAMAAGRALASRVDFIDLDGSTLIQNDVAEGFEIVNGRMLLSPTPGLGISTNLFESSKQPLLGSS